MLRPGFACRLVGVVAMMAAWLTTPAPVYAQTNAPVSAPEPQGQNPDPPITFRWGAHPSLRIGRVLRLDFVGRLQREVSRSQAPVDDEGTSALDLARTRVGIEGTVRSLLAFQLERELGETNGDPWRDVYVDVTRFTAFQVQGGKFKLPFSLDENTGATNLDFAYRSLIASQLAPGRDRGVMVHGELGGRLFDYAVGLFEHDGKNARSNNPERMTGGRTGAARLFVRPFGSRSRFEDVRVGVAATSSYLKEGRSTLKGKTVLGADVYQADAPVLGRRDRLGAELRWRPGPASIKAEYIRVMEQRRAQSVEDTELPAVVSQGWYVSGTWALTGEIKADGLDRPKRPLYRGGFGAIEVAGRIEQLLNAAHPLDEEASTSPRSPVVLGNRNLVVTAGVNWYPVRGIKIQGNVIREQIADATEGPLPSRSAFWSRVLRVQVGF